MKASDTTRGWPANAELAGLVRAAQQGDPGALDALLGRLRPSFLGFFARRIAWDDAEDWTQVALIALVRVLPTIDADRAAGYMVRSAQNLLQSERRRRARELWRLARQVMAVDRNPPLTPDRKVEYLELVGILRARLATLSPKLRNSILGVLRGLTTKELAAEQHVNHSTLRTRLLRARLLLRRELAHSPEGIPHQDRPSPGWSSPARVREGGTDVLRAGRLVLCFRPSASFWTFGRSLAEAARSTGGTAHRGFEYSYPSVQNISLDRDVEWGVGDARGLVLWPSNGRWQWLERLRYLTRESVMEK